MKPRVFVGSSIESLEIARAVQQNLDHEAEVVVWTDGVFSLTHNAYQALAITLDAVDAGIFILSGDDSIENRGTEEFAPRDNVVFELGLFAGRLGLEQTFIIHSREDPLKLPTDLLGITTATFETHSSGNLKSALGAACSQIREALSRVECTSTSASWGELCAWVSDLASLLKRSHRFGGFPADILVGVSRGGVIVTDLLARKFGETVPSLTLWADRRSRYPDAIFSPPENWICEHILPILRDDRIRNILIIDDVASTGQTIKSAKEILERGLANMPGKNLRTAVLVTTGDAKACVDYFVQECSFDEFSMPYSLLE